MTLYCYLDDKFNSKTSYNKFFNFHCKYVKFIKEFVKQKRAVMKYFRDKYRLSWSFSSVGCLHRGLNSRESPIYLSRTVGI